MAAIFIKQKIKDLLQRTLLTDSRITSEAEVDRYIYATKLGKLEHIDYAVPLFGYAREARKDPVEIYSRFKSSVTAEFPCQVEFVNGYLNIMFDAEFLRAVLHSHLDASDTVASPESAALAVTLLRTSTDMQAVETAKILQQCLDYAGLTAESLHPLPGLPARNGQYRLEPDEPLRQKLTEIPGVVQEANSKALYIQTGDDSHALCSVKGGWYAPAFMLAAIKDSAAEDKRTFVVGTSGVNKLIRDIFPTARTLDVDLHAKHVDGSFHRPVRKLLNDAKKGFQTQSITSFDTKRRRELLYALDFEYEITEAARLGDLKRLVGEVTTLFGQYPLSDIS